ncbi:MAG: FAD binding domain-containing protein [Rhodocyclaceae bacterium]|nr:FAD binding domain-containing protein [Rhodocyclaceae bacterium]
MSIHFILNRDTQACDLAPGLPLLDHLRDRMGLTAAKAGCREGDCGACGVLLGRLDDQGRLAYRSVNACLVPLGALDGAHVLTVEGLGIPDMVAPATHDAPLASRERGGGVREPSCQALTVSPTPVQRALVEEGGIQCGFCTPGMVIALTAHLLGSPRLDRPHLLEAMDGNLCRCTGYMGIKRAGERLHESLSDLPAAPAERVEPLIAAGVLPEWLRQIPPRLADLPRRASHAEPGTGEPVLAGATDLLVQRPTLLAAHEPWFADTRPELHGLAITGGRVKIGATTTMQELLESEDLAHALPELHRALGHIASTPVRDRATVGGNLANASPIGDLSILLLALDAELLLVHHHEERRLALSDFFLGYKRLDLAEGELLAAVEFDLPFRHGRVATQDAPLASPAGQGRGGEGGFHFEKVAHRDHLDIASVNCALMLELDGRVVRRVRIAAGGVAPMPLRLRQVEALLTGAELGTALALEAARAAAAGVSPIDDVRGSARYKRLLLRQLVLAGLLTLAPFVEPFGALESL